MACLPSLSALVPSKVTSDSFRSSGASVVGHEVVIISLVVVGVFAALSISFIQNPRGLKGPPQWKGAVSGLSVAVGAIALYHLGPWFSRHVKQKCCDKTEGLIILDSEDPYLKNPDEVQKSSGWQQTKAVVASTSWLLALAVSGAVAGTMLGLAGGAFSRRFRSDFDIFTKVLGGSAALGVVGNVLIAGVFTCYKKYQRNHNVSTTEI